MFKRSVLLFALVCCATSTHAAEINLMEQLREGGAAILVTTGLSILFVAVTIERLWNFRARAIAPRGLVEQAKPLWAARDHAMLHTLLEQDNSTLARIIGFMWTYRDQPHSFISSGAGDIASLELRHHQQKFYALSIVATVAPIVGLLGTVIGMIDAFNVIAFADGMGNPALLAAGISKALINTAAGLAVALPALAMHHYFKNRLTFFSLQLEKQVNALIQEWFAPAPVAAPGLQVVHHAH
jgi:biopolymer transport protein ExbB